MKICRICETSKPLSEFGSHKGHRDGLQNYCRPCNNALHGGRLTVEEDERRRRNNKRYQWAERKVVRRGYRYNVSPEEFEEMKRAQDGRCKICSGTETYEHKELCVDHDHLTGEVRGLLCSRCNKALGGFRDDPGILKSAIAYLAAVEDRPLE